MFSQCLCGFFHSPKTYIDGSKLAVGVNVSVNGSLSLCVSPMAEYHRPVQGVLCLSTYDSWDRLQPTLNGWIPDVVRVKTVKQMKV